MNNEAESRMVYSLNGWDSNKCDYKCAPVTLKKTQLLFQCEPHGMLRRRNALGVGVKAEHELFANGNYRPARLGQEMIIPRSAGKKKGNP
jgi:hypothetical protein